MSTPTTTTAPPPAPEKPKTDPFLTEIANSFNSVLDDTGEHTLTIKPGETKIDPVTIKATRTMSDVVEMRAAAEGTKVPAKEGEPPPPPTPGAPPEPPKPPEPGKETPPPETPPKEEPAVAKVDLGKALDQIPKGTSVPATAPAALETDEYVKTLTEDEQEEVELARFAEKNGLPGHEKKTVEFFKARDKWVTDHPDDGPESEAFQEFLKKSQPVYPNRRKLERSMIEDRAVARAQVATSEKTKALEDRQRAMEAAPKIEAAVNSFRTVLTDESVVKKLPKEVEGMTSAVVDSIVKEGFEAAKEKYPIEAPVVQGTLDAAAEYLRTVNGLTQFDPDKNPMHRWLSGFINGQESFFMAKPEAERTINGRTFLPMAQYVRLSAEDAKKHWTFDDQDILDLLAYNAHMVAAENRNKAKKTAKALGYVEADKALHVKTANGAPPPAPAAATSTTSPKAGGTALPGATTPTPPANPNAAFLNSLVPGAGDRLAV